MPFSLWEHIHYHHQLNKVEFFKESFWKKVQNTPYFFTAHVVSSGTFNGSLASRYHGFDELIHKAGSPNKPRRQGKRKCLKKQLLNKRLQEFFPKRTGQIIGDVNMKITTTSIFRTWLAFQVIVIWLFSPGISVSCCIYSA